uniref:Alternative protein AIM2 n=1 Tax=Homo sapiens TaxID=9606 RepID=L8E7Q5_HUMAN|nr:alternative protein AIM2 [Homo sapiens]
MMSQSNVLHQKSLLMLSLNRNRWWPSRNLSEKGFRSAVCQLWY